MFYNTNIINRSLQAKMNAFAEAGVSYGRVLMKDDHSELKVGITGQIYRGYRLWQLFVGPAANGDRSDQYHYIK